MSDTKKRSPFDLTGRAALVTGAGAGIGEAVAREFARAGAAVLVTDIDAVAAKAVADDINAGGGTADFAELDVRDAGAADAAVAKAAALNDGVLNVVVNNAGAIRPAMFHKMDPADFDFVLSVHLSGAFTVTQAALAALATDGTGRVINVTSAAGLTGTIGQVNYGTAKAGIIGMTKSFARELAKRNINVNALAPLAATTMTETVRTDEKLSQMQLDKIPLKRWADPAEIAPSFVYLAADSGSYTTGQILPVDGGTVI